MLEAALSGKSNSPRIMRDPKYGSTIGSLRQVYWSDTVANAVAWWKEHRDEYTPEALETAAPRKRRAPRPRPRNASGPRPRSASGTREVPLQTGQWRRVTIGTVVTFPDERGATIHCMNAGSTVAGAKKFTEDHVAKHGTKREIGARFEVVHARGDALARVRFVGDAEVTWVASREVLENAAAER